MFSFVTRTRNFFWKKFVHWLTCDRNTDHMPLSDFDRLRYELRPGDVLLIEGQSKISDIIKMIIQSIWTHSLLYVGRIHDIDDPALRKHIKKFHDGSDEDQIIIESLLGQGTIADSLEKYRNDSESIDLLSPDNQIGGATKQHKVKTPHSTNQDTSNDADFQNSK